jgi:hypothetical protein
MQVSPSAFADAMAKYRDRTGSKNNGPAAPIEPLEQLVTQSL